MIKTMLALAYKLMTTWSLFYEICMPPNENEGHEGGYKMKHKQCIIKSLLLGSMLALSVSGCKKNPDNSIIKEKNMDNMIEEAQNTENGTISVQEAANNYDSYQADINEESLNVTIHADAEVDIPEVDNLAVMRVAQAPVTQEMIDRLIAVTVNGKQLYDGSVLSIQTKKDIENEIAGLSESQAALEHNENYEVMYAEYQLQIDEHEQKYQSAPDEVNWDDYKSDGKLIDMSDIPYQNDFYEWTKELNENGSICYVITHEGDAIYAQNNYERGNCLRYSKGTIGTVGISTCVTGNADLRAADKIGGNSVNMIWNAKDPISDDIKNLYPNQTFKDANTSTTTLTKDEAIKKADDFLTQLGIENFEFYYGDIYNEACFIDEGYGMGYRTYYILQYIRKIDDVFVTYDNASKHEEGWQGDAYVKKDWGNEIIEFRINDDGIIDFRYETPIEITDTVVEKSALKSFDEVKDIFEQMAPVTYASNDDMQKVEINIDRVVLGYARISEPDSYDTGLMVPVWDFIGTKKYIYDGYYSKEYKSILTINAIDGTVINRELGY